MIQGQTLPAVFADAQGLPEQTDREERSNRSRQISAYISLSRVRKLETIWVLQPFALSLFQQGPPPGPAVLLERLLGDLTDESIEEAFARHEGKTVEKESSKEGFYACKQCLLEGRQHMSDLSGCPFLRTLRAWEKGGEEGWKGRGWGGRKGWVGGWAGGRAGGWVSEWASG